MNPLVKTIQRNMYLVLKRGNVLLKAKHPYFRLIGGASAKFYFESTVENTNRSKL